MITMDRKLCGMIEVFNTRRCDEVKQTLYEKLLWNEWKLIARLFCFRFFPMTESLTHMLTFHLNKRSFNIKFRYTLKIIREKEKNCKFLGHYGWRFARSGAKFCLRALHHLSLERLSTKKRCIYLKMFDFILKPINLKQYSTQKRTFVYGNFRDTERIHHSEKLF